MTKREELQEMFQKLYEAAVAINVVTDDEDYDKYTDILEESANVTNAFEEAGIVEDGIVYL